MACAQTIADATARVEETNACGEWHAGKDMAKLPCSATLHSAQLTPQQQAPTFIIDCQNLRLTTSMAEGVCESCTT